MGKHSLNTEENDNSINDIASKTKDNLEESLHKVGDNLDTEDKSSVKEKLENSLKKLG